MRGLRQVPEQPKRTGIASENGFMLLHIFLTSSQDFHSRSAYLSTH